MYTVRDIIWYRTIRYILSCTALTLFEQHNTRTKRRNHRDVLVSINYIRQSNQSLLAKVYVNGVVISNRNAAALDLVKLFLGFSWMEREPWALHAALP